MARKLSKLSTASKFRALSACAVTLHLGDIQVLWMAMQYALAPDRKWDKGDRILVSMLILIPCALRLWIHIPLDNDTFFLLSHGRYVFQHGLPTVEPFTFHEGLRFVMQQWLSASIFFFIYNLFGFNGLYILTYIYYVLYGYFTYKLSMLISDANLPISTTISLIVCVGIGFFVLLRPWLFSILIFIIQIYCLELYISKGRIYYLIYLPLLSLLLINLHAAVWPVFFILLFPYFLDGFRIKNGLITTHGYRLVPIVLFSFLAALSAFINPYSIDALVYFYNSYGNRYIKDYILEMQSPSFQDLKGFIVFCMYIFVVFAYSFYKAGTTRLRYILITLVTGYMGLSSIRNIQYFLVSFSFLAYYYRDFDILKATGSYKQKADAYTYLKLFSLFIIYCFIIFKAPRHTEKTFYQDLLPLDAANYIINNLDANNITLFNDYDVGSFLEFKGIRTFIDPRAEVFLKSNNKKDDILNDYFEVIIGKTYYVDFIRKYGFSHFLAVRGSLMDTYLSRDSSILLLYEDKGYRVFAQKSK